MLCQGILLLRTFWVSKPSSVKQETEAKGEAINVSDRSNVVTACEFGGCLSVLISLWAWGGRKDLQPDVSLEPMSGFSLLLPIPGPNQNCALGRALQTLSAWSQTSKGTSCRALVVLRGFLEFLTVEQLILLLLLWDWEASHNKYMCLNNHSFSRAEAIMMT